MSTPNPKLEHYWANVQKTRAQIERDCAVAGVGVPVPAYHMAVNWRLIAANGEVMCQCTQGFRDKADSLRNAETVLYVLLHGRTRANFALPMPLGVRSVGPGKKPS